jgi:ribA/ribD-fused uncharacterized protein
MPDTPLLDRLELEKQFGGYNPERDMSSLPNIAYRSPALGMPSESTEPAPSALTSLENYLLSKTGSDGKMTGGSIPRPLSELTSNRYNFFIPGDYNNEDAYAQGQGWTSKMVNSVGKGLLLTGTTLLQSTFGLLNGMVRAIGDGRAASFYDNGFNRRLDEINKAAEDVLPNYYTDVEKNASWYSPDKLFTANFFWNGIVKNMGFAAGAALSGGVFTAGLKALPLTARLFSVGKAAETLAATEQGLLAANKVAETYGKVRSLSDKFLSSYNLLNPGGRALVAGLATTGEAGFEAYHNLNEYRDNLIQKYREENNGLDPRGADLEKINALADNVGNSSFLTNVGLLSVTNYIQFPKILGSTYTGEKGIINSLTREIRDVAKDATGRYAEKAITTTGGKLVSTLDKIRPYTFSASEAFEEGAQFAITKTTQDYYNKKYRGQATSWLESLSEGITETLGTNEGMENVLIGGFSGALMQARGRYVQNAAKSRNTADAIQAFNRYELSDFTKETIDSVNRGTVLQQEREELLKKGDVKGSKDKETDYIINYLSPRIKYGRYDLVMQDIADYKQLAATPEGFAQLQAEGKALPTDSREAYMQRILNLEKTADNVKSLYQSLNLRYGSIVDKEGNLVYTPAVMDQMVYAATKVADYDTRIPKLADQLNLRGVNVNDIIDSIVVDKKPNKEATSKAIDAINDMNVLSDVKNDLKQNLIDIIDMSLDRNQFLQEYDTIKNNPKDFYDKKAFPFGSTEELAVSVEQVDPNKPGKTITKKLEVGEDYYLKKPFSRQGNTIQVAPKLRVLSQTLGGEFEVLMPNGNIEYLTPQEFKQFDLSDAPIGVDELNKTLENAINNVLSRKKYTDVKVPENTSPIDFVNSLNNSELMDEVETEFDKLSQKLVEQREQEQKAMRNAKVIDQALNTQDRETVQTAEFVKTYEADPKKSTEILPRATAGVMRGKPHQMRANKFGLDLESLPNRKNIRGVYVTSKNEDQLIPGLTEHLRLDVQGNIDETISKDDIIALVMVDEFGNLVGVDGNPLPEGADKLNSAIYQVFPTASLTWSEEYGGKSMFREGTPDNVIEAITKQYKEWRDKVLANPNINERHTIGASFGIPLYVKDGDGNTDWNTKTSVEDAGLITAAQLERDPLIFIPKDNEKQTKGTVSFSNPMGKPFLNLPNGLVKLRNRNLTKKEAETIYQALLQLSKNMQNVDEWVTSDKSVRLLTWLRSIVYWGIPTTQAGVRKPAGYNSVFWEKDGTGRRLMLSLKEAGKDFSMTPIGLEENKAAIIEQLQKMYNNINSSIAKNLNEPYEEITSIAEDGSVESRIWPNYQTYLLSNKNPNGGKRSGEDLPLSTPMVPKTSDDVMNRMGIYFYTADTADDFVIPKPAKPATPISSTVITAAGVQRNAAPAPTAPQAAPTAAPAPTYILDGRTINKYVSPGGKVINFKAPEDVTMETINQKIILGTQSGDYAEVAGIMERAGKNPEIELKKIIFNAIAPELDRIKIEMAPVVIGGTAPAIQAASQNLGQPINDNVMDAINIRLADTNDEALREMIGSEIDQYQREDWNKVEAFIKANLPNIPVYRVKNVIQATNGRQAWGMYRDGAIYIYTNAEVGTAYHEVFHAVWRMFADSAEREAVMNELRKRGGSFFDKKSRQDVKYSEATDDQLEEKLAEEFRDYVQEGKIPAKPKDGRPFIVKLFADLVKFIKEFFVGPKAATNTEELFKKIGNGYYKNYSPNYASLAYAKEGVIDIEDAFATSDSEFSLVGITDKQRSEIINEMTYLTLGNFINTDEGLFSIPKINRKELYDTIKTQLLQKVGRKIDIAQEFVKQGLRTQENVDPIITSTTELMQHIDNQWDDIVKRHEEYLNAYSITFDENDDMQRTDENKIKESDFASAEKIDGFRKANGAIKLLLATIPIVDANGKPVPSSIGGTQLLPISQTYISVMNNVHDAISIEDMLEKLRVMAANDRNYRVLYKRLTKSPWDIPGLNFSNVNTEAASQLIGGFWQTFKKQDPEVKNVFILEDGTVVVGDANLSNAAVQLRADYIDSITQYAKNGKGYFKYDTKSNVFVGDVAKARGKRTETPAELSNFLEEMGISFSTKEIQSLSPNDLQEFRESVQGIKKSIIEGRKIATFSGRSLDISNRLLELALFKAKISNPQFDSTYFNLSGERVQSFLGPNAVYDLYNFLSQLKRLDKDSLAGTQYEYLLSDDFTQGSVMIKQLFASDGLPKSDARKDQIMRVGYVGGTLNEQNGRNKESAQLTYKERVAQEINLNLAGYYLNLVPGDASLEWMLKMGNVISLTSLSRGRGDVYNIFRDYFISEMKVGRDPNRPFVKLGDRKRTDLRFFKSILGESLHDEIVADTTSAPEAIFDGEAYGQRIRAAIDAFIDGRSANTKELLDSYGVAKFTSVGIETNGLSLPRVMNENDYNRHIDMLSINYIIANIELHKLAYGDPYQYKEELKRTKSFNSPRQAIVNNSPTMNGVYNSVWNKGYSPGDVAYTNFTRDYFRTVPYKDVQAYNKLLNYGVYDETDGAGIINMKANRNFRIRAGKWNSDEERQYKYDMAWKKRDKGLNLSSDEERILREGNPNVQSAYVNLKPIVSGNKANGQPYNEIVLDKFALYVLSYRLIKELNPDANLLKLDEKMDEEDIDYVVFNSGRKVGSVGAQDVYNENGEFNDSKSEIITNVPFSIMSVQSEVPSKEDNLVTRGSQPTKLVTMDLLEAGVPIDFFPSKTIDQRYKAWMGLASEEERENRSTIYAEIKKNQKLLEELTKEGYLNTLDRLGIKEITFKDVDGVTKKRFEVESKDKAVATLRSEILKREVNDNISDALQGFLEGKAVLEATPAYQQIRNILYSIADKNIVSPKVNGGLKVQIPSSLFESNRIKPTEINGKMAYTSDLLKFYEGEDGKRYCEIMVARWFDSDLSDDQLMDYFNNTEEGKKQLAALAGVAFRVPTQKQNSIESFRIAKFLPKGMGDSVVVPSEIVKKVGSDFDIDKLSIYLKNVYVKDGKPKLVPSFANKAEAIEKLGEMFDKGEFLSKEQEKQLNRYIDEELIAAEDFMNDESNAAQLMKKLMGVGQLFSVEEIVRDFTRGIKVRDQIINNLYKKSLENQYIESFQNLVETKANFIRLTSPNSAEQLKDLARFVANKTTGGTFDYNDPGNMLDRTFMSRLRHAYVRGKYAIGIAAVAQTNHSLNQRQLIYIDRSRLENLPLADQFWLGDATIKFDKYNSIDVEGKGSVAMLSGIQNADGQDISDIIGQFIDGYVDISKGPWIMELGATPNVASTWLFLVKIGVPIDTVSYFMNQTSIRNYLRSIENAGYSYVFNDGIYNDVMESYLPKATTKEEHDAIMQQLNEGTIPSKAVLKRNVGMPTRQMSKDEKLEQAIILKEFLKYAKMAEHLFHVTQGTNWDTATLNDPYLVLKKEIQLQKAQNTIISSVEELMENAFIGELAEIMKDTRNAFAQLLLSDKPRVRAIIHGIIAPYATSMSDREFVKLARKAVNDLFDYAVQIDQNLNLEIQEILLNDGGVATEMLSFVNDVKANPSHPLHNNYVVNIVSGDPSKRVGQNLPNNLKVKGMDNRTYDQNNIIYAFRELRDYFKDKSPLYDRLVSLAILQSGLSSSPISFTSVLPYEDFERIYNQTLSRLEAIPNLENFQTMGVFQRNNWNNDDIVPYVMANTIETAAGPVYNPSMKFLPKPVREAVEKGTIPPVVSRSIYRSEGRYDYIVYRWEKGAAELLTEQEKADGLTAAKKKAQMRKEGDYSFIQKGLFKKVYDNFGNPLLHNDKNGGKYFIYKAINAWGDGYRANEFWDVEHTSDINNGFIKTDGIDDNAIISEFEKKPSRTTQRGTGVGVINIYAGTGENAELSNFANRRFQSMLDGKYYDSVEQAFQSEKYHYTNVDENDTEDLFNKELLKKIKNSKSASEIKRLGRTFKELDTKSWEENSSRIMKELIKTSFEQNPDALAKLLATGNAELTHTQDRGKWGREFPRLLMEVREELRQQQSADPFTC